MVPGWLQLLINAGPLLLVASCAVVLFGVYRLKVYLHNREADKADEEEKRQIFLAKMEKELVKRKLTED